MLRPCQAKPGPTKCFPLPLGPINTSAFVRHPSCGRSSDTINASRLEAGSETPEQQQDSSPCQAKRSPTKCFPLPLEPIRNSAFVRHPRCEAGSDTIGASPLEAGSETPEQQQDSSPCQAKPGPTKCFPLPLEPIINTSPFVRHPSHWRNVLWRPVPKHPNSSRIRAHAKQNAARQMLPVTFGTYKKQFFCPAPSVRGWFPNHWRKTLGGGDPTKCLAHAKQNPAPQNASPYL